MNGNPLNVIDPDGKSGVAVVKGNEIVIKQNFYFTTDPSAKGYLTPSQANEIEQSIRNGYSSLGGKVEVNGVKYSVRFEVNFIDMTGKDNGQIVDAVTNDTYSGHRIGNFLSTNFLSNQYEKNDHGAATDARVDILIDKMKDAMKEGKSDGNTPTHEALHNIGGRHEDGGMLDENHYTPNVDIEADGTKNTTYRPAKRRMTKESVAAILSRSFSGENKDLPIVNEQ